MKKIDELFLTFFFCGKVKKAPGTVASIASVVLWFLVTQLLCKIGAGLILQNIFWAIIVIGATIYGVKKIPGYVARVSDGKEIDHQSITLDEFIGQVTALQLSFIGVHKYYLSNGNTTVIALHLFSALVLFRYFDIKKPSIIGEIDRQMKNEVGVMADDFLSGIAAGAIAIAILLPF